MNNTLVKGLRIIHALAHRGQAMGVSELASSLGLAKSDAHRLLQSLVGERYVVRHEGGLYSASIKLWELGSAALLGFDLRRHAEPVMDALMLSIEETVHLSVLDEREVVYVHKVDSVNPVRAYSQIGGRAAAHCVATGKALMAFRKAAWLEEAAQHLTAATPRSLTDPAKFLAEMTRIRRTGYAINRGEWQEMVNGLAAPIFDGTGVAIAAIGISGPASRLTLTRLRACAPLVMQAGQTLSQSLSEAGPHASLWSVTAHWASGV